MQINGEEVERVDDFNALREWDVVYVVPCVICEAPWHRGAVTNPRRVTLISDQGLHPNDLVFTLLPSTKCLNPTLLCTPRPPRASTIYRVVDPKKTKGEDMRQGHLDAQPRSRMREHIESLLNDQPYGPPKKED